MQAQVFGLARFLAALGHEVWVVGPADRPVAGSENVEVLTVGPSVAVEANGSRAPIAVDAGAVARTFRVLRRHRFDILHLHEPLVPGPTMGALIAARVPTVGTFHLSGTSASYSYLGPLVRHWAQRLSIRCCVSEEARKTAASYLAGEYRVLFNGVDVDRWAARGAGGSTIDGSGGAARSASAAVQAPVIAFVGRHEERKGLSVLLDAFALLRGGWEDRGPAPVLRIAGDGPETAPLRARWQRADGIEWCGSIRDDQVVDLVAGADVLCAPSTGGESFGIVLVEAMAAGTPVVASDIPGYRQVASGGAAVLVPPADSTALAGALGAVLTDPERAVTLAAAGHTRAASFSLTSLAAQYSEMYASLV